MLTSFLKDKDGNISSRILFITTNTILTWLIIFICIFKNIDIQTGVLTLLITLTAKSGVDSIGQVYQNIKENTVLPNEDNSSPDGRLLRHFVPRNDEMTSDSSPDGRLPRSSAPRNDEMTTGDCHEKLRFSRNDNFWDGRRAKFTRNDEMTSRDIHKDDNFINNKPNKE